MYLSDLIEVNANRGGVGSSHVYIPNDLVYTPWTLDPLIHVSIKSKLLDLLTLAEKQGVGSMIMTSLQSLDGDDQQLIRSVVQTSEA